METNKSIFTTKNILKACSMLLIVFFFCPVFLVSCGGEKVNVSAVHTVVGYESSYGDQISDPQPLLLIALALPIIMLIVLLAKSMLEKKVAISVISCACIDLIVWFVYKESVKAFADENGCDFKTTAMFGINIFVIIVAAVLSLVVILDKIKLNTDLLQVATGDRTQGAINQMSSAVTQMTNSVSQMAGEIAKNIKTNKEPVIGYCQKCGTGIPFDTKFCVSCGHPVPEILIAEAEVARQKALEEARIRAEEEAARRAEEAARRLEEEARRKVEEEKKAEEIKKQSGLKMPKGFSRICPKCGASVPISAKFCSGCGMSFENEETNTNRNTEKVCSKCGRTNPQEAVFCVNCGSKLEV